MSIGPMGASIASSLAASNQAQRNADVTDSQQATSHQSRSIDAVAEAEKAAGIGDPDESQKASDRDADGRRLWERQESAKSDDDETAEDSTYHRDTEDPTGIKGREIDLDG